MLKVLTLLLFEVLFKVLLGDALLDEAFFELEVLASLLERRTLVDDFLLLDVGFFVDVDGLLDANGLLLDDAFLVVVMLVEDFLVDVEDFLVDVEDFLSEGEVAALARKLMRRAET